MMTSIQASVQDRRSAKAPHELFIINTVIVHLFFSVALGSSSMINAGRGEIDEAFMQKHL